VTWRAGHFGKNAVEEATATFRVIDDGADLGAKQLKLTHHDDRPLNHKHPATWIHWETLRAGRAASRARPAWYNAIAAAREALSAGSQGSVVWFPCACVAGAREVSFR